MYGITKESLTLFKPIIELLNNKNIKIIYYGDINNRKNEWFIYFNEKYYFYDLTIFHEDKKHIIEYNGEKFHPNKEKLNNIEWMEWRQLYHNKTADEVFLFDEYKKKIAIDNGFKVLTIWAEDKNLNTNKILEFLKDIL
jgi:hypothetical protein